MNPTQESGNVSGQKNNAFRDLCLYPKAPVIYDGNTVAWYDFDDATTVIKDSANLVSLWNDKLLSGRDLIQATGSKQPLWSALGVLFDGGDDFLKTGAFTFIQPAIVYLVFKQVTWSSSEQIFSSFDSATKLRLIQYITSPQLLAAGSGASGYNGNLTVNAFGIIRSLYNGASSKLIVNKTTPTTYNCGTGDFGGFTVGASGLNSLFSNIEVKEIILRKVADTEGDEADIYNYLSKKYGIV